MNKGQEKLNQATKILEQLGMPKAQLNNRTALCLLCLLNMQPQKDWQDVEAPLMGITPIMEWSKKYYNTKYAPNSRETFRRFSMHQLVQAGICLYNPDNPKRPVNSPNAVYGIEKKALRLIKTYGTEEYEIRLVEYLNERQTLSKRYAKEREMNMVPVKIKKNGEIQLSPGKHSELIGKIIEDFGHRYVPEGTLIYVGDTGNKDVYFDKELLKELGVILDTHGKFPDVIIYNSKRNWLLLIESVTSHGPIDSKRHGELSDLFKDCKAGLVYVSAFLTRKTFLKYSDTIAWETEVWIAESPTHMIHFNGLRFLGPADM